MADLMGNTPAKILSATNPLTIRIRFRRSATCKPRCRAVLDSDMVASRIHKCARKHSLVTDIQMSLRNLVNRIRSVCI